MEGLNERENELEAKELKKWELKEKHKLRE